QLGDTYLAIWNHDGDGSIQLPTVRHIANDGSLGPYVPKHIADAAREHGQQTNETLERWRDQGPDDPGLTTPQPPGRPPIQGPTPARPDQPTTSPPPTPRLLADLSSRAPQATQTMTSDTQGGRLMAEVGEGYENASVAEVAPGDEWLLADEASRGREPIEL